MRTLAAVLVASVALAALAAARADEPLAPPAKNTVRSANGKFVAVSEPATKEAEAVTTVSDGAGKKLWTMKGWHRSFWLADDGEHLVVGYPGLNLVTRKDPMDQVMVQFFKKGELLAKVTLDNLLAEASLEKTVSHYHWGMCRGFDEKGRFVVSTVERKEHLFDVTTGKLVETRDAKK